MRSVLPAGRAAVRSVGPCASAIAATAHINIVTIRILRILSMSAPFNSGLIRNIVCQPTLPQRRAGPLREMQRKKARLPSGHETCCADVLVFVTLRPVIASA